MLGDSNPQFLQSLRLDPAVFQTAVEDLGPSLANVTLSISKLRRTGVSHNIYIFIKIGKSVFAVLCFVVNVGFVVYQNSLLLGRKIT